MKVGFLGTGGSVSSPKRDNTSIVFKERELILVDCNGNPSKSLQTMGFHFEKIHSIVFTHHHTDHVYSIPSLIHQTFLKTFKNGRPRLNIYGSKETLQVVKNLLRATGLYERDGMFEITFSLVHENGQSFDIGDSHIKLFPVSHGNILTFGMRIETKSLSDLAIIYSSDTEPTNSLINNCTKGDILIHECNSISEKIQKGHTNIYQIENILNKTGVYKIYLVHLPPINDEEDRISNYLKKEFGEKVILATDLSVFEV